MKTLALILVAASITLAGNLKILVYNTQLNQNTMNYCWSTDSTKALELTYMDSSGTEQVLHAQRVHTYQNKITVDAPWIVGYKKISGVVYYSIQEVERIK